MSPAMLSHLLDRLKPPSATLLQMVEATYLPWSQQMGRAFDAPGNKKRSNI